MSGELTPAQREQRREAATTHGARSELAVRRVATVQKRRLLRQVGLRANELDGIGLALLDNWARAQAKVELMDGWSSQHGWLDEDGKPPAFVAVYFAALNSARLTLGKLSEHLKATSREDVDGVARLMAHGHAIIEARNGDGS